MTALAATLSYAALAALALAMPRHHRSVFGREATARRRLAFRASGWALLGLSLASAVRGEGWAIGLVAWCATLTAAGLALTLLLAFRPRWWAGPIGLLAVLSVAIAW